jgi:hypothetical protein
MVGWNFWIALDPANEKNAKCDVEKKNDKKFHINLQSVVQSIIW